MNFNPDFSEEENSIEYSNTEPEKLEVKRIENVSIIEDINKQDVVSMSNLIKITLSQMQDSIKCREELQTIGGFLTELIPQMSIKELTEYYKVKLREQEFYLESILKAYSFVQKSDIAKEMFAGSDRKERILKAIDRTRINKWMGLLNSNANTNSNYDGG